MPKVYLDPIKRRVDRLTDYIKGEMDRQEKTQQYMADVLNISQPAFHRKFKRGFKVVELLRIFADLKTPSKIIGELLGYEEK